MIIITYSTFYYVCRGGEVNRAPFFLDAAHAKSVSRQTQEPTTRNPGDDYTFPFYPCEVYDEAKQKKEPARFSTKCIQKRTSSRLQRESGRKNVSNNEITSHTLNIHVELNIATGTG